jgi:hypothetical protein
VGALIPLEHAGNRSRYLPEARLLVRAGANGGGLDDRASTRSPDRLLARWRRRQRCRGGRCHGRGSDKEGSHHEGNQGASAIIALCAQPVGPQLQPRMFYESNELKD